MSVSHLMVLWKPKQIHVMDVKYHRATVQTNPWFWQAEWPRLYEEAGSGKCCDTPLKKYCTSWILMNFHGSLVSSSGVGVSERFRGRRMSLMECGVKPQETGDKTCKRRPIIIDRHNRTKNFTEFCVSNECPWYLRGPGWPEFLALRGYATPVVSRRLYANVFISLDFRQGLYISSSNI